MSSRKKRKAQQEDCAVCIIHSAKSKNENLVSYSVDCFEKLLDIKRRRLESTAEALRMADVCVQIPSTFSEGLGYHRDCYQKFTMNLSRFCQHRHNPLQAVVILKVDAVGLLILTK